MMDHDHHHQHHHDKPISPEVHEAVRSIVGAIRAVRIYPPGNPIHSQAITRMLAALETCLAAERVLRIGVHTAGFSYLSVPLDREAQVFRGIAVDLFEKGVREIAFSQGVERRELADLLTVISIPKEDLKQETESMETILWEKGLSRITVTFAGLDEVIVQDGPQAEALAQRAGTDFAGLRKSAASGFLAGKEISLFGRRIMLSDLAVDPGQFGATLVDLVKQPGTTLDQQLEQLLDTYRDSGRQFGPYEPAQKALLFRALAESILAMEPAFRDGLIAGKLYGEADRMSLEREKEDPHEHVPNEMHERLSGRIARTWTPDQVAALLERTSETTLAAIIPDYHGTPIDADLQVIARELSEYTAEEIATFKFLTETGNEDDISRAALHTITSVLPLMDEFLAGLQPDRAVQQFSNLIGQLDELLISFINKGDYRTAVQIVGTLRMETSVLFKPRFAESLRKAADRPIVSRLIGDLVKLPGTSADRKAANDYLALLDHEAVPALLEILADENELSARKIITQFLKELGMKTVGLLGGRIADSRWYFVRNIVMLLGESRNEEALPFLNKAANHESTQVRQAVIKALLTIGGEKARLLLFRFLDDKDPDVQISAAAAAGVFPGAGKPESRAIIERLKKRGDDAPTHEFTKEAISVLGKIGDAEAEQVLQEYRRVRWWKSKQPQEELKAAAERAIAAIARRRDHA